MGSIKSFKDIKAWQAGILLVREIYIASQNGPFSRDFALRDQIRKAVLSIPSNIAEGFEREGNKEFIQFLTVAKGSTGEVQTQLRIAWEVGYITEEDFKRMDDICTEVINMISGFLRYLRSTKISGNKFNRK